MGAKKTRNAVPRSGLKPKVVRVISFSKIPFSDRKEESFDDVSYGDAVNTLTTAGDLLQDRTMDGYFRCDAKGNPLPPNEAELSGEEPEVNEDNPADFCYLQPLAWELFKIRKDPALKGVLIGLGS